MRKSTRKILPLILALAVAMGTLTACGNSGANYTISNLTKYDEIVEDYVISPNVSNIMSSQGEQIEAQTLLSSSNVANASEDVHYNDTQTAYETLPDSLVDLENAAKYLANKIKPSMVKIVSSMPEENVWIGFTAEEYMAGSTGNGTANFAKLNTTTAGVLEYTHVAYDTNSSGVTGGTYIKLTDTAIENEPIVEYYSYTGEGQYLEGEYLYYVPNEQIYVNIVGISEYYCINDGGEFTSVHNNYIMPTSTTIINGSVENGFIESHISLEENQDNYYIYYKDNHKIMSLDYWDFELDMYYASEVEIAFSDSTIVKNEISSMFGSAGYEYVVEKTAEGYTLPSGVTYEELSASDQEKYQAVGTFTTTITTEYGSSGESYYVTKDGYLKSNTDVTTLLNRQEGNNLSDLLYTKDRFDDLYEIYADYFNEESELLSNCASIALDKISKTSCSFDFANFKTNIQNSEVHYQYSGGGSNGTLVENYSTNITCPNLTESFVSNNISGGDASADVTGGNASYSIQCSYNGYDIGNGSNVILAAIKDGKMTTIAQGDKTIKISSNDISAERTLVDFDLNTVLNALTVDGNIENGRYDFYAYFQDDATKTDKLDSLAEIIAPLSQNQSMFMYYAIEKDGKYYNVKVHTADSSTIDFDESFYIIIEEVQ